MKLLIDFGNTRIKWAWLDGGQLRCPGSLVHEGLSAEAVARRMLEERPGGGVDEVRLASVALPGQEHQLAEALQRLLAVPLRRARVHPEAGGLLCAYPEPRQLGVDRWLALAAAHACYRSTVCVVDAGTAWTIDVVRADGLHLGGLIIPGPALMREALLIATDGISAAAGLRAYAGDSDNPEEVWGRDTDACMRLGAWRAGAALVESCMTGPGLRDEVVTLVLTGGAARRLARWLSRPVRHHPLLVLEGLALPGMVAAD